MASASACTGGHRLGGRADAEAEPADVGELRYQLSSERRRGARTIRSRLDGPFAGATLYRARKRMREPGMHGIRPRASRRTTVADPDAPARPDPIRRDFAGPVPAIRPVGDIAYLRTGQGWPCMAAVIDLCTRMVAGMAFSERMTADLPVAAPESAWGRGYVALGAVPHSDRGSRCTSKAMAERAAAHDVRLSVGRTGSCHDNAAAGSFFGTFKNEMYRLRNFATREEARIASVEYVEGCYNRRRPHSTIDYRIPAEAMGAFFERMDATAAREEALPLAA